MFLRIKPNRALAIFTVLASLLFLGILFQNRLSAGRYLLQGYLLAPFTSATILGSIPSSLASCPPTSHCSTPVSNANVQPSLFAASFDLPNMAAPIGAPEIVPRIIHQVRLGTLEMRQQWTEARASCRELMPEGKGEGEWEYLLWTDETGDEFVQTYYSDLFATYRGYKQGASFSPEQGRQEGVCGGRWAKRSSSSSRRDPEVKRSSIPSSSPLRWHLP
jgi:hypothetical protein